MRQIQQIGGFGVTQLFSSSPRRSAAEAVRGSLSKTSLVTPTDCLTACRSTSFGVAMTLLMTLRKAVALFFMAAFLATSPLIAAEVSIELSADQTTLGMSDEVELSVTIRGVNNPPTPTLANLADFSTQQTGQSSQVSIINGQMTASTIFSFIVAPTKEGTFEIGPASISGGGQTYSSNTLRLTVGKNNQAESGDGEGEDTNQPIYVDAKVDKLNPYIHEQVIYTFRFYNRSEITGAEFSPPEFSGFWKEDLGKQQKYTETINGQRYSVTQIRFALFPSNSGKLTIDPCQLLVDAVVRNKNRRSHFDSFFDESFFGSARTKRLQLKTRPIEINVRPLPAPPEGYSASPLVGNFSLKTELTPRSVDLGDPTTLTLSLSATGNVWDALLPALDYPNFRSYPDKPTLATRVEGDAISGTRVFKFALVPQTAGDLTIPGQKILFFNPQTERYEFAQSEPMTLQVIASEKDKLTHVSAASVDPSKTQIKVLGSDLMPIKRGAFSLRHDVLSRYDIVLVLLLIAASPLSYLGCLGMRRRQLLILQDEGFFKRKQAFSRLKKQVQALGISANFAYDFSAAMRRYLADRCDLDGAAITGLDAERLLAPKGIDKELIAEVRQLLKVCDDCLYGGKTLNNEEKSQLQKRLLALATNLEKELG